MNVNYEDTTFKSSPNDYDYCSHINDKIFRNQKHLEKFKFEGHFDDYNYDSSELKQEFRQVERRRGQPFTKEIKNENGEVTEKKFYRYFFMLPLSHGLCRGGKLLPGNVHVRLTFHRASSKKSLIDVSDSIDLDEPSISLNDPVLQSCWSTSETLKQRMRKISSASTSRHWVFRTKSRNFSRSFAKIYCFLSYGSRAFQQ